MNINTTEIMKASRIFCESVQAIAEIEAMKAENKMREIRQESPAYNDDDFLRLKANLYNAEIEIRNDIK